jgi:hypothetical protein
MNLKSTIFLILIGCFLPALKKTASSESSPSLICYLSNFKYKNEYLYVSNQFDTFDNFKRKVFTSQLENIDDLDDIKWILIPIEKQVNQYFIRSYSHEDEYLCSSHSHLYMFKQRRRVGLIKLNNDDRRLREETKCKWRIDLIDNNNQSINKNDTQSFYSIWNVYYREPFYAASSLFKQVQSNSIRNVYTWHSSPNSHQFIWNVECAHEDEF